MEKKQTNKQNKKEMLRKQGVNKEQYEYENIF